MAQQHIPIRLLTINNDGYHLQIRVKVNGKAANCLIDTGASKTVFDQNSIRKFLRKETILENEMLSTGLGTNSMQSQVVELTKFQVGTYQQANYTCILLDLSHVNQTYTAIGLKPIHGVIGSDWLESAKAIIDFGKKRLTITSTPKKEKRKSVSRLSTKTKKKVAKNKTKKRSK